MLNRFFCVLFILALFLPTLQHSLNLLPSTELMGVEHLPPSPDWTLSGWMDGSFQKKYGKRRDARLGLRSHFIKTYNQLQYTLFHRIVSSSGTSVVIGKDNWLYEQVYITKMHTASKDDGSLVNKRAANLRKLQDALEKRGIALVYVIAPSKAEVYPEYIPDKLLRKQLPPGAGTDYLQAISALKKHGIHVMDSHTLFLKEKEAKEYQLFGPSGVHWNKYGAYLAWKNIVPLVQEHLRVPLQIPALEAVESRPSEPVEADLGRLLNLWNPALTFPKTDYPRFAALPTTTSQKPSLLIVGDSFLFTLVDIVERAALATDVDAWYYFKRHFSYPVNGNRIDISSVKETVLDRKQIDWKTQLLNKDLVVLVSTEYWLPELGFGFVEEALAGIEQLENKNVKQ